jgi:phosphate-selective porin OprO/OprP
MTGPYSSRSLIKGGGILKKHVVFALALASVLTTAIAAAAGPELAASWSNGLSFQSEDKNFKFKIGGRIQDDWAWFEQSESNLAYYGNIQDGTEFRRARIALSGAAYQYLTFKAEFDFAGAAKAGKEVAMKDVYMGITGIPYIGTVQMGHQKEPFGLEVMTSSNYTTFMERAISNALAPERNSGIRMQNAYAGERIALAAGVFRDTDDGGRNSADGSYAGTVRLTALPWVADDKGGLLHVGGAYSYRKPGADVVYEARPSAHLAPVFVGVEGSAETINLYEGEGAICYGPFRVQGEYMQSAVSNPESDDLTFQGYYVYASAFVTGEKYGYKKSEAVFEHIEPKKNFRQDGTGIGAWEAGVRYGFVDLNDESIYGGELTDVTVGVNWYLASNTRIQFNYVRASVENAGDPGTDQGSANIFETRFHVFF